MQDWRDTLSERELEILTCIADGLSDDEIAQRLFLSANTVKWHNRQIYQKLDVKNRTQAVALARRQGLFNTEAPSVDPGISDTQTRRLPIQLNAFVGRQRQIDEVTRLIHDVHLLTLTGPAGTGKTRLAIRVVSELPATAFRDGIYFIDLAPVNQPERVADAIIEAIGLLPAAKNPSVSTLTTYLASRASLLILDNFEHLIDAASLVSDLLAAAPQVRILVTSREALGLYGEQEYPVPPLELPDMRQSLDPAALAEHEAISLFVQRARSSKPDFTLTDDNAAEVAAICVRLDGLPLAIELAAARAKVFTTTVLLARLDDRLSTLTGGARNLPQRQQTLADAIKWSYDLLDEDEQTFFARLSVFQGGRTFEAVDHVCMDGLTMNALAGLESLHNKSLLRLEEESGGELRFVMLETIHEFARQQLEQSGESQIVHRAHAEYFMQLAESAFADYRGPQQRVWVRRLHAEQENIRKALHWAITSNEGELATRLVTALSIYWFYEGFHREGIEWVTRVQHFQDHIPLALKLKFLIHGSMVQMMLPDPGPYIAGLEQGLALAKAQGDELAEAWGLVFLGIGSIDTPETQLVEWVKTGIGIFERHADQSGIAQGLNVLGQLYKVTGDYEDARAAYEATLDIVSQTGEHMREYFNYMNIGQLAFMQGEYAQSLDFIKRGMRGLLDIAATYWVIVDLVVLGGVFTGLGDPELGAQLIGASEALCEAAGMYRQSGDRFVFAQSYSLTRSALGDARYEQLVNQGRAMTRDEVLALADQIASTAESGHS